MATYGAGMDNLTTDLVLVVNTGIHNNYLCVIHIGIKTKFIGSN